MTDKLRDKTKRYKIKEEEYGHPLREPYKRDRHNYLVDDDPDAWAYISQDSNEDVDPEDDDVPF